MRLLSLITSFPNSQSPLNLKRVRDKETGELVLSDAAKNYHPGQGVYRSAYKNAMRMARTEINAAYLRAEIESYQSNPLVTGYEIKLSGNHTTTLPNGKVVHLTDICDKLAGKYPKTFMFTGWHPQCRCYIVPITIKDKEANKLIDDKGTITPDDTQGKQIDELPGNMQKWLEDNQPRIDNAKQLPPFITDNKKLIEPTKEHYVSEDNVNAMSVRDVEINGVVKLSEEIKREMAATIRDISDKCGIFNKRTNVVFSPINSKKGALMKYDKDILTISTSRFILKDGTVFCPAEQLQSAFVKIKNKKDLTFKEEYAIESLVHESVHAGAQNGIQYRANTIDEMVYETCTQLYAREKYVGVLTKLGVAAKNYSKIRIDGYGYQGPCNLLRGVFSKKEELQLGILKGVVNRKINSVAILKTLCNKNGYNYNKLCELLLDYVVQ